MWTQFQSSSAEYQSQQSRGIAGNHKSGSTWSKITASICEGEHIWVTPCWSQSLLSPHPKSFLSRAYQWQTGITSITRWIAPQSSHLLSFNLSNHRANIVLHHFHIRHQFLNLVSVPDTCTVMPLLSLLWDIGPPSDLAIVVFGVWFEKAAFINRFLELQYLQTVITH